MCCVKYGVTRDYVLGMEVVVADGRAVRLGGPRLKDVAGLDLTSLFVGSEGTLGVITGLTLRLLPPQPPAATVVATFPSIEAAAHAVTAVTAQLRPSMLELMDRVAINAVEDAHAMGLDRRSEALLIAQSDAPGNSAADEAGRMVELCRTHGSDETFITHDVREGESFMAARRAALPALERQGSLLLEDVGVPVPTLPTLVHGICRIADQTQVRIALIAHAGDGNTHPIIVYDPRDDTARHQAHTAFDEVMKLAITLGGTITGEHGVGRLKRDYLPAYLEPAALELHQTIKHALDPLGILNPGAMLQP